MSIHRSLHGLLAAAAAAVAFAASAAFAETVTLVPYGADVRYEFYPTDGTTDYIPPEWLEPTFDDSSWRIGRGPFGTTAANCPVDATFTSWTGWDGIVVMRFTVEVPLNAADVWIEWRVSHSSCIAVDGVYWGCFQSSGNCPWYQCPTAPLDLQSPGSHVVVLKAYDLYCCLDHHRYFDFQIVADVTPASLEATEWGAIKAMF
jgi:hypothetical protein